MALDWKAYCINNKMEIEYIDPVHTQKTARSLVDYWKKHPALRNSFAAKNCPKEFREKERTYWEEYDRTHKCTVQEYDADALPW